jgi:TRAP-type C4-dicarboxylate transport system permease small subunit
MLDIIAVILPVLFAALVGLGSWALKLKNVLNAISEVLDVPRAADDVIEKSVAALEDNVLTEVEIREIAAAVVELKKQFDEAKALLKK